MQAAAPEKKVKAPNAEVLARLGDKKNVEDASEDDLKAIIKEYYER